MVLALQLPPVASPHRRGGDSSRAVALTAVRVVQHSGIPQLHERSLPATRVAGVSGMCRGIAVGRWGHGSTRVAATGARLAPWLSVVNPVNRAEGRRGVALRAQEQS